MEYEPERCEITIHGNYEYKPLIGTTTPSLFPDDICKSTKKLYIDASIRNDNSEDEDDEDNEDRRPALKEKNVAVLLEEIYKLVSSHQFPELKGFAICSADNVSADEAKQLVQIIQSAPATPKTLFISSQFQTDGFRYLFSQCSVNKSSTMSIKSIYFHTVELDSDTLASFAAMLSQNMCLESLTIVENEMGDDGMQVLSKALSVNTVLRSLHINGIDFGNLGLMALAEALTTNTALQVLILNSNHLGSFDITEGMKALFNSIRHNSTLKTLSFAYNELKDDILPIFVDSMQGKTSPIDVDFSSNSFDDGGNSSFILSKLNAPGLSIKLDYFDLDELVKGIQERSFDARSLNIFPGGTLPLNSFFETLAQHKSTCSIVELSFTVSASKLNCEHMAAIAKLLPMTKVHSLYLSFIFRGGFGDEGVHFIAKCLNESQLTNLHLVSAGIEDGGLIELCNALQSNTKLTKLEIRGVAKITQMGLETMLNVLKHHNNTLHTFGYDKYDSEKSLNEKIEFYLKLNKYHRQDILDLNLTRFALYPYILQFAYSDPSMTFWLLQNCPHLYDNNYKKRKRSN